MSTAARPFPLVVDDFDHALADPEIAESPMVEPDSPVGTATVTGATNANPIVVTTSAAHNLWTGAIVIIKGVGGNTNANGTWVITVLSGTTFSIPIAGNAAYTSGGTVDCPETFLPNSILLGALVLEHKAVPFNTDTVPDTAAREEQSTYAY